MIVNRFDYDKKTEHALSRAGSRLFPLEKGAKNFLHGTSAAFYL